MDQRTVPAGLASAVVVVVALSIFDPHVVLPVLSTACVMVAVGIAGVVWRRDCRWRGGQKLDVAALLSTAVVAGFLAVVW